MDIRDKAANLREDYNLGKLEWNDLDMNPMAQFQSWFEFAIEEKVIEPNAMTLATVGYDGLPSARIVLLKGYDERGFFFYTNYQSEKARQMSENPNVALIFNWLELHRQIRIEGSVETLEPHLSDQYYQSRPKGSRMGAWVSPQSMSIANRIILDKRLENITNQMGTKEAIPRPPFWGGYRIVPRKIEFWQGRTSRLHDRFVYTKTKNDWGIQRIAP